MILCPPSRGATSSESGIRWPCRIGNLAWLSAPSHYVSPRKWSAPSVRSPASVGPVPPSAPPLPGDEPGKPAPRRSPKRGRLPKPASARARTDRRSERTDLGIINETLDPLRHGDHRLLDHVLGLGIGQAGLPRHAIDQVPIGVEKLAPTGLVGTVPQPVEQALPGGNRIVARLFVVLAQNPKPKRRNPKDTT
jgi:hypothetical protein